MAEVAKGKTVSKGKQGKTEEWQSTPVTMGPSAADRLAMLAAKAKAALAGR